MNPLDGDDIEFSPIKHVVLRKKKTVVTKQLYPVVVEEMIEAQHVDPHENDIDPSSNRYQDGYSFGMVHH